MNTTKRMRRYRTNKAERLNTALEEFIRGYIECALWASLDDDERPLDSIMGLKLSPELLKDVREDCTDFFNRFAGAIRGREAQAGHDFWLTRNGHGAGFWDGDWTPYRLGKRLSDWAKTYGSVDLYVRDGMVYQ